MVKQIHITTSVWNNTQALLFRGKKKFRTNLWIDSCSGPQMHNISIEIHKKLKTDATYWRDENLVNGDRDEVETARRSV